MRKANPINIHAIDHVVLRVKDLDAMLAFYTEVLGCRLERMAQEIRLAQLRAGLSLIDLVDIDGPLGRAGGGAPAPEGRNMDHFCVQVVPWDADAILAHLRDHGVDSGGTEQRYGATGSGPSIYLKDPEGNTVELKGAG